MRRQDRPPRAPFAALVMIKLAKLMWPGDLRKATLQPVQDEQRVARCGQSATWLADREHGAIEHVQDGSSRAMASIIMSDAFNVTGIQAAWVACAAGFRPASASFKTPMICSSVNRYFIAVPLWNGLYTVTVLNAGSRSIRIVRIRCNGNQITFGVPIMNRWYMSRAYRGHAYNRSLFVGLIR